MLGARGVAVLALSLLMPRAGVVAAQALPVAAPNANRVPAGRLESGVLTLSLEAREVAWQPEGSEGKPIVVLAFAEEGRAPQIPGPLIRVTQGTEVRLTLRNAVEPTAHVGLPPNRQRVPGTSSIAGPELTVHGLRAGTMRDDTIHISSGAAQELQFSADRPGTFLYWAAMSRRGLEFRTGTDSQLTGVIVVDPVGVPPDHDERIFVITMLDMFPDPSKTPPGDDLFKPTINGLSWPAAMKPCAGAGSTARSPNTRCTCTASTSAPSLEAMARARPSIPRPKSRMRSPSCWNLARRFAWCGRRRGPATGSCTAISRITSRPSPSASRKSVRMSCTTSSSTP
jgi:FtsP/CotA-like multicopper oxidase with cupredoxin domain